MRKSLKESLTISLYLQNTLIFGLLKSEMKMLQSKQVE